MLSAREAVWTLPTYHPPLAGREGLRLDFNENASGCSPRVIERLQHISPGDLAKYPERGSVESKVADFLKIAPEETLLTNGVDEAIHLLCETYLDLDDEALIVVPTYAMYRIYAKASGAQVIGVSSGNGFSFPAPQLSNRVTKRTRLIAIANPNNPAGTVASAEELLQIADAAPDAAVLVDEAYFEFYGQTMLGRWCERRNLFITRTFSKAYGMAGLRIGVLAGDAEQIRAVRRVASPYNVNAIALACLPEAIADQGYIDRYVAEVLDGRERLCSFLIKMGIEFWPSQANFVLVRVGSSRLDSSRFVEEMKRRGILVRDRSADEGCEGCVRITLGPRAHTDRLLAALRETLAALGAQELSRL